MTKPNSLLASNDMDVCHFCGKGIHFDGRGRRCSLVFRLFRGHSSVHWKRNCSADHTAMQTIGHSSIDVIAVV